MGWSSVAGARYRLAVSKDGRDGGYCLADAALHVTLDSARGLHLDLVAEPAADGTDCLVIFARSRRGAGGQLRELGRIERDPASGVLWWAPAAGGPASPDLSLSRGQIVDEDGIPLEPLTTGEES